MAEQDQDRTDQQAADQPPAQDTGADQEPTVDPQQVIDTETEQGFRGIEVDPTPNENYTAAGVTSGKPTPETDDDAAEEARVALADVSRRAAGVAER